MLYMASLCPLSPSQNPHSEVDISNQSGERRALYLGDRDNNQNVPASPIVISAQLSSSYGFPPLSTIFGRKRIMGNAFCIREFKSSILSSPHTLPPTSATLPERNKTISGSVQIRSTVRQPRLRMLSILTMQWRQRTLDIPWSRCINVP